MTPAQERRMQALAEVCVEFKRFDPGMPLGRLEAFILVVLHEGKSLKDLCQISGQPQSTLSRHLLDLGEHTRRRERGLGLVEWRIDPYELRRKQYLLTPKGRELLGRLLEILEPSEGQRGRRSGPSER
jgi:DNA-binding MarR family transcriptional regulator